MREKAFLLAILIFLLAIAISGCDVGVGGREPRVVEYRTGTQGLDMSFIPGTPPLKLYEGDPLSISVEYSNKGVYPISSGYLYISGYDKNFIRFLPDSHPLEQLEGKSEFNPLGGISRVFTFKDEAVNMPAGATKFPQNFIVTACYKYKTETSTQVCIDPDPYAIEPKEKVCTIGTYGLTTQGAPVAVTSVEEEISRGRQMSRAQFKIFVSNVGGGDVFDDMAPISECHTRLERDDLNKVYIDARFSDIQLECEPQPLRLSEGGQGFAICSWSGTPTALGETAYLTVLNVDLYYGYRDSVRTSTEIIELPE